MSKMNKKSNRYDNAYAEVSGFQYADDKQKKSVLKQVRQEIPYKDANRNHVLLLTRRHDPVAKVYNTDAVYQMFGNKALDKMSKQFKVLGYDRMVLIHKAEKPRARRSAVDKKMSEIEKKIEELENYKLDSKINTDLSISSGGTISGNQSGTGTITGQFAESTKEEEKQPDSDQLNEDQDMFEDDGVLLDSIKSLTVPELKDFAEQNNIDLQSKTKKDDIVEIIYQFQLAKQNNK